MQATAETVNYQADLAAAEQLPARYAQPFNIGQAVVPWAIERHPYQGPGSARASDLKQYCAQQILQPPHLRSADMYHPGTMHQDTTVLVRFDAITGCDAWERLSKLRFEIKRSGRWINWEGSTWAPLGAGGPHSNEAHDAGFSDAATNGIVDRCVNGQREPVRIQDRNQMRVAATGKIVAVGRIVNWPINVHGGC